MEWSGGEWRWDGEGMEKMHGWVVGWSGVVAGECMGGSGRGGEGSGSRWSEVE